VPTINGQAHRIGVDELVSEQTDENKDTGAVRHGDSDRQPAQRGIGGSIRPGVSVPATVQVYEMGGGALLCQGWRDGSSAYVCAEDAGLLRQALAAAFGSAPGSDTTATS